MFLGAKPNVADGVSRSGDVHSTLSWWRRESGQAMVEMAVSAGALLLLLFGGLQMAVILNAVLAVSQYSYAGARYAAVHGTGQTASSYGSTLQSNVTAPPTIAGAGLSTPTVTSADPSGKITSGSQLTVQITYNLATGNKLFFTNSFMGFTLPTTVSNSTSVMAE